MFRVQRSQKRGFTLVQLLVVMASIILLMELLLATVEKVLLADKSQPQNTLDQLDLLGSLVNGLDGFLEAQPENNLDQLGLASHDLNDNSDSFPSFGRFLRLPSGRSDSAASASDTGYFLLLSLIEQDNLDKQPTPSRSCTYPYGYTCTWSQGSNCTDYFACPSNSPGSPGGGLACWGCSGYVPLEVFQSAPDGGALTKGASRAAGFSPDPWNATPTPIAGGLLGE